MNRRLPFGTVAGAELLGNVRTAILIVGATGSAEACFGLAVPKDLAARHRSIKCLKKTICKAVRTWAASMADKRACRGLRVDQRPSKELCATTEDKSSQRTKIVLNNPGEWIAKTSEKSRERWRFHRRRSLKGVAGHVKSPPTMYSISATTPKTPPLRFVTITDPD